MQKKILLTCFIAGCLEVYDFTIFGYFADIIRINYLSFLSPNASLIVTYLLFAIGFIFRPLGSLIFGYIGDKYGRKIALTLSIFLMSICALGMAILPTYDQIGISACYLIVIMRILQGISIGGEYSGCIIFAVEHFKKKSAGFVGSIVVSGCMSGVLLSTLISNILKNPLLPNWSWRIAFFIGFILSIIGFYIRLRLSETPEYLKIQVSKKMGIPLLKGVRNSFPECISTIFIGATSGVNLYFISVYLPKYISTLSQSSTGWLTSLSTFIMAVLIPVFGNWSDKIGRIRLMEFGSLFLTFLGFILIASLSNISQYTSAMLIVIVHAIIAAVFMGPMNTLIIEIFRPEERYSSSAFSYSLGMGVIGGTAPMISSMIDTYLNDKIYIAAYIAFISFLGYLSVRVIKFRKNRNFYSHIY